MTWQAQSGAQPDPDIQYSAVPPRLRLGKYVIEGLLGPGGVTETYLAHPAAGSGPGPSEDAIVALKLLRRDRVAESSFAKVAERFVSTGRQLRDFHRPGFCKVVDVSDDPAATFVVSEYIAGSDLTRIVDLGRSEGAEPNRVSPELVGLIGSEIARLLHVGHSAKPILCHLGLAPSNVIVLATGEVVLLDAGISAPLRTITEQPIERWAFVAPELQGVDTVATPLLDRRSIAADLYGLGAVLHFLLTGQPPKRATSDLGQPTPDLPGASSKLNAALRTLLAREPDDRPESAAVLVEWLADGTHSARDRQRQIAEGLHRLESVAEQMKERHAAQSAAALPAQLLLPVPRKLRVSSFLQRLALAALVVAMPAALLAVSGRLPSQTAPVVESMQDGRSPSEAGTTRQEDEPASKSGVQAGHAGPSRISEASSSHVAGHLIVETIPPGAMVWVDGVLKARTFADLSVGAGEHRVALIAPGRRMFRGIVDTSNGAIIRRTLPAIDPPGLGNGSIEVRCRTAGKYPILIDEEETGLLCPASLLASSGKHSVGIFVPRERRSIAVETTVDMGAGPAAVTFNE
jgi:serine/threonine protein kinase